MVDQVENIIGRADAMKSDRGNLDAHCEQIREIFYPEAASFISTEPRGEKLHQKVYDSTGEQAGELLAAGVQAMTCNNSVEWLDFSTDDPDLDEQEEVAVWLEDTKDKVLAVCSAHASGFVTNKHEQFMELVHFGTAPLFIGSKAGRPFFQSRPLAQTFIAENGDRMVDTVFWRPSFTARQAVSLFGKEAGEKAIKAADDPKKCHDMFEFIHAVYPRDDASRAGYGGAPAAKMPFASCWVNVREKKLVRESGFEEFPYACPRWRKRSGEAYGRSPAMKVLADCRMLQRIMRTQIRGVEKIVDPPWMVADDGVMSPLRVHPSSTNTVRGMTMRGAGDPIRPLLSGGRPDLAEEFMNGIRQRIENGFHVNLFQFARDPKMTATQYLGITEQTMQAMNPMLGRLQTEDLGPMVERLFALMWRAGMLLEPPEALQGRPLRVKYVSPVAKQQRIGEARAVAQLEEIMMPALARDPTLADNIDGDKVFRGVGDLVGVRKDWMRPPDKVQEIRAARQQAQEQAAQAESMRQTAESGAKVMQALPALKEGLTQNTEVQGNA